MPYLVVALVAVAGVALLNLVLTLGVVHRLREHSERLSRMQSGMGGEPLMLEVGSRPSAFSTMTVDGTTISEEWLDRPALVGFFSPDCAACRQWLPRFVAAASIEDGRVLAVVAESVQGAAAEEIVRLREAAEVAVEPAGGALHRAFSVRGWPAMCRLDAQRTVVATDLESVVAAPAGR